MSLCAVHADGAATPRCRSSTAMNRESQPPLRPDGRRLLRPGLRHLVERRLEHGVLGRRGARRRASRARCRGCGPGDRPRGPTPRLRVVEPADLLERRVVVRRAPQREVLAPARPSRCAAERCPAGSAGRCGSRSTSSRRAPARTARCVRAGRCAAGPRRPPPRSPARLSSCAASRQVDGTRSVTRCRPRPTPGARGPVRAREPSTRRTHGSGRSTGPSPARVRLLTSAVPVPSRVRAEVAADERRVTETLASVLVSDHLRRLAAPATPGSPVRPPARSVPRSLSP